MPFVLAHTKLCAVWFVEGVFARTCTSKLSPLTFDIVNHLPLAGSDGLG